MTSTLRPITAVKCPQTDQLVSLTTCDECPQVIEVRRPWRHFAVQCSHGDEYEGVYQ